MAFAGVRDISTTSDTPTTSDDSYLLTSSNAALTTITLDNTGWTAGTSAFAVLSEGAAGVTFAASGTTINNTLGDATPSLGQYAIVTCTYSATNVWTVAGQLIGDKIELVKDSASSYVQLTTAHDTEATTAAVILRKADGSNASPAAVDDNAVLGKISFEGYDGNSFASGARIEALVDGTPGDGDMPTELVLSTSADGSEAPSARLTIKSDGKVGLGVAVPATPLHIVTPNVVGTSFTGTGAGEGLRVAQSGYSAGNYVSLVEAPYIATAAPASVRIAGLFTGSGSKLVFGTSNSYGSGVTNTGLIMDYSGNVIVAGSISKGSGTFDIAHPVRDESWRLRHSFIEGPRADLIYRGSVTLPASGSVEVNLDEDSGMTPGTWQALNGDPWSMVSSSGNAVEWGFSGETLTVTGPSGALCQWLVIGERRDDTVMDWDATDGDGHLIVEYQPADD